MNITNRSTVVGVFADLGEAKRAVEALRAAGFPDEHIGFIARRGIHGAPVEGEHHSHAAEGAAGGAIAGGALGTVTGLAVAAGIIPAIGPAIAGGILAGILASAGTGVVAGGVIGALIGLGIPEEEATYYESALQSGRPLVTVRADGRFDEAFQIMQQHGAIDIEARGFATARQR
jgi:hypothetical protein